MILVIDLILTHGGGQQVLVDFVHVARRAGKDVVAVLGSGGWLEGALVDAATPVAVTVPSRRRSSLFWRALRSLRFCGLLFRNREHFRRASVIVVNDPEAFVPSILIARLYGKGVALYVHMAYAGLAAKVIRISALSMAVDRLICVSRFVLEYIAQIVPSEARNKLVLIENAFPASAQPAAYEIPVGDVLRIGIVGRLIEDKGQDIVCALSYRLPGTQFYIVGPFDNSNAAYVEKLQKCSASNVHLVGYKHPIVGYLREQRIGIVLVPSRIAEALPLTPIEATLAGCAVVARNVGGLAEVARNIGVPAVEEDGQFEQAIRTLQAMPGETLRAQIEDSRRRVMDRYHPSRFDRDVREVFGWR